MSKATPGQSGEARIFLIQDDNLTAEVPLRRSILQSTLRQKYRSTGRHNPQRDGGPEKGLYRLHPIALPSLLASERRLFGAGLCQPCADQRRDLGPAVPTGRYRQSSPVRLSRCDLSGTARHPGVLGLENPGRAVRDEIVGYRSPKRYAYGHRAKTL